MSQLFNCQMHDGSRQFTAFPESCAWEDLQTLLAQLPGACITQFISDDVLEMWLDFTYCGHEFSVNNQEGEFWFFVKDPNCPDEILLGVIHHCKTLTSN